MVRPTGAIRFEPTTSIYQLWDHYFSATSGSKKNWTLGLWLKWQDFCWHCSKKMNETFCYCRNNKISPKSANDSQTTKMSKKHFRDSHDSEKKNILYIYTSHILMRFIEAFLKTKFYFFVTNFWIRFRIVLSCLNEFSSNQNVDF